MALLMVANLLLATTVSLFTDSTASDMTFDILLYLMRNLSVDMRL